jgi:hypothetical protein
MVKAPARNALTFTPRSCMATRRNVATSGGKASKGKHAHAGISGSHQDETR